MKKFLLLMLFLLLSSSMVAGSAMAISFGDGGSALQGVFNDIAVDGVNDVNVATDYLSDSGDSSWSINATGGAVATVIVELAGFADNNIFGIYNNSYYAPVFLGADIAGYQATISILANGMLTVTKKNENGIPVGFTLYEDFGANSFGFYLDSSYYDRGGIAHSDSALNSDGLDHMAAYQGVGERVQIDPYAAGDWGTNEYIFAFEDLFANPDWDYTDFVVMVESVSPVPEPATMLLLGTGLLGLGVVSRKKLLKK